MHCNGEAHGKGPRNAHTASSSGFPVLSLIGATSCQIWKFKVTLLPTVASMLTLYPPLTQHTPLSPFNYSPVKVPSQSTALSDKNVGEKTYQLHCINSNSRTRMARSAPEQECILSSIRQGVDVNRIGRLISIQSHKMQHADNKTSVLTNFKVWYCQKHHCFPFDIIYGGKIVERIVPT